MGRGLPLTLGLLAVVAAVNVLSLLDIVSARAGTRRAAEAELVLQTEAHARSLEALLDNLQGELLFLARGAPVERYLAAEAGSDPLVRRWSRLDAEGALLLFLEAHPAVEHLVLEDGDGRPRAAAARRRGAPVLIAPEGDGEAPAGTWPGRVPLSDGRGAVAVRVDPRALLAVAAPGVADRLAFAGEGATVPAVAGDRMQALARFASDRWVPPLSGTLLRVEEESRLLDSVEELAGRYRLALVVNGAIMTLTLLLGLVALGQVRRSALLEAAHRYQEERRDLERRLFHSERLSSLGRLAAGMAHEINNPLEGMANYLTLLSEDLAAGRVEDAPRLLARLRQGLDRVAGAVRQVLAFAAPGQAPRSPLDLAPLLTETVEFLRGNPAFRAVRLTVETPPGPVTLVGDRLTLGQLFLNLLLNACQAQLEGGEVMVRLSTGDQEAVIEIADRGPGLAPEVAARLFEPFVSTRGSSGLGLAVCHGIATSHGGSITAGGRSGGGTVFTVRLPLEAPPEAAS